VKEIPEITAYPAVTGLVSTLSREGWILSNFGLSFVRTKDIRRTSGEFLAPAPLPVQLKYPFREKSSSFSSTYPVKFSFARPIEFFERSDVRSHRPALSFARTYVIRFCPSNRALTRLDAHQRARAEDSDVPNEIRDRTCRGRAHDDMIRIIERQC